MVNGGVSNSINSSQLLLHKKTKTVGNISRSRMGKHKNILSKKAVMVAEKARKTHTIFWNLFIVEKVNLLQ